jgi:hypothetical protein
MRSCNGHAPLIIQVVGTVTQGGDRVQVGAVGLCTAIHGSALGIWDSACTVDEHGQVVIAIVNLVSGDCVGSMSNSVFEADGCIYKLNDESVNTIFGNIGKVPEDPNWVEGPPIEPKEQKVLKERLQVLAEDPWRQQYIYLMLRYHDVCSKDKFDLGCADVIEYSIIMEDKEVLYEYVDKLLKSGSTAPEDPRGGTLETTKVRSQAQREQDDHRSEDSAVLGLHTVRARSNAVKGQACSHQ